MKLWPAINKPGDTIDVLGVINYLIVASIIFDI